MGIVLGRDGDYWSALWTFDGIDALGKSKGKRGRRRFCGGRREIFDSERKPRGQKPRIRLNDGGSYDLKGVKSRTGFQTAADVSIEAG